MNLTDESLQKYVGGQLEIQNPKERYIYRGEVSEVSIVNEILRVKFSWLTKAEEFPSPVRWTDIERKLYEVSLLIANSLDIGEGRVAISTGVIHNELLIFFPPDGSKPEPTTSRVWL